jgi:hypothetical protein
MTRSISHTAPRPVVGLALTIVGIVHVLITPVVVGDSVRSIIEGGVVAAVERDPAAAVLRGLGFWYVTAGLAMIMLGAMVIWIERTTATVPMLLPWMLVGLTVWGVLLMPVSPFWVFLLIAFLAFRKARRPLAVTTASS